MTRAADQASTLPANDDGIDGREHTLRLVSVGFILALVIATAIGIFGVRTASRIESAGSFQIEVAYAAVTRPGLATPFDVTVQTTDGSALPSQIAVRVDSGYLAMFDENGLDPTPSSSYQTTRWTWWTFDNPDAREEFTLSFDARLEPGVQWGRTGSVTVLDGDDDLVSVAFRTWVIP
jgi:hypothetical protein